MPRKRKWMHEPQSIHFQILFTNANNYKRKENGLEIALDPKKRGL